MSTSHSMVAPLKRVVMKRPAEAFRSVKAIDAEWRSLDYLRAPDLNKAVDHHHRFAGLVTSGGAEALYLPIDDRTGLDSIYVHDPLLMTDAGALVLLTGKVARRGEGPALGDALAKWGFTILGTLGGDATAEAGDMLWLDRQTLLVGRGFRTNASGITALQEFLKALDVTVIPYDMPCWNGISEVLHLQSFISLLDQNLAVIYRKLLPVAMFELLNKRGIQLIDVPESEYESLACNILTIAPRRIVMVAGNPITRSRLEAAGCTVLEFDGSEICLPGAGGPTCLTRPLLRG